MTLCSSKLLLPVVAAWSGRKEVTFLCRVNFLLAIALLLTYHKIGHRSQGHQKRYWWSIRPEITCIGDWKNIKERWKEFAKKGFIYISSKIGLEDSFKSETTRVVCTYQGGEYIVFDETKPCTHTPNDFKWGWMST